MRACVVDLDLRQPNWQLSRCGSMKERNHFPTIDSYFFAMLGRSDIGLRHYKWMLVGVPWGPGLPLQTSKSMVGNPPAITLPQCRPLSTICGADVLVSLYANGRRKSNYLLLKVDTTMGIRFPIQIGIPWESHAVRYKTPTREGMAMGRSGNERRWEWEWPIFQWENHGFFYCCRLALR